MKVDVLGQIYHVDFTHASVDPKGSHHDERRFTKCVITLEEDGTFLGAGIAKCYYKDNYDKEEGRQQSLKKALADAEVTKEGRTIIWSTYRNWGGKSRF